MFEGQNDALKRASAKGRFGFQKMNTQAGAYETARAGWLAAAWMVVSYAFTFALTALSNGPITGIGVPTATQKVGAEIGNAVAVLLAIGLAWIIRAKQPRWACILLLAWLIVEAVAKVAVGLIGLGLFINIALIVVAVRSVMGAFKLAAYRRPGPQSAADVFK